MFTVLRITHKILRKYLCLISVLILLLSYSNAEIIDKIVASVNGEAITLSALENELKTLGISDSDETKKSEVLNELINRKLLLQEARRMGIELSITMEEVEKKVESLKTQYSSEEAFLKYLEKEQLSISYIKERMKESLMVSEMVYRKFMRPLEIESNTFERKALTYYENNKSKYTVPEKIKLHQVVVLKSPTLEGKEAEAKSQEIWKKLKQGITFSELHRMYSDDTNVIVDYEPGYVEIDKFVSVLKDRISKLKIGDLSKPILTTRGYFIVRLIEHKPKRQKSFDEVADEIKNNLMSEQVQKDLEEWLNKQREESDIRVLYSQS